MLSSVGTPSAGLREERILEVQESAGERMLDLLCEKTATAVSKPRERKYATMTPESLSVDLVDQALWRLHFADGNTCVAESGEATYLVLFTTPERAEEFVRQRHPGWNRSAAAALYSATQEEFLTEAGETAAQGLDGAVIDPEMNGQVLAIIDFCREDSDIPVPPDFEDTSWN
jgi:hypothetical protein